MLRQWILCWRRKKNLTKKIIKIGNCETSSQGFVESFHEGGMTEDGEVFCLWGWRITDQAHETEEYQKAYNVE